MSTPPNPPSSPSGPPAEPAGTPIPEPAQPLSLRKTPEPAPASEPEAQPAPAPAPAPGPQPAAAPAPQPEAVPAPAPAAAFTPPGPAPAPAPSFGAPMAPGGPGGPGGPVPPVNPWGAHAVPGATPGNPWGAPTRPTNGLAVAALVIGIAAVVIGIIPFVFWAGCLLAVVGVGIGIGALVRAADGAGRKTMAVVGTALAVLGFGASVGGFLLTGLIVDKVAEHRFDEDGDPPSDFRRSMPPFPRPSPSPSQVPGMTSPLPFGETYTYPNGIKVTLSAPKKYVTKNKYSQVGNAVEMTLTITNGSSAAHNVIYAMPNVRDEKGMTAKLVFDGDVPKMIKGDILPGESASGVVAFEVPEGTERISADISPGILLPDAKFSGPIG